MLYIIVSRAQIQEISCTIPSVSIPQIPATLFLSLERFSISYFSCKTYTSVPHHGSHCPCGHPDTLTHLSHNHRTVILRSLVLRTSPRPPRKTNTGLLSRQWPGVVFWDFVPDTSRVPLPRSSRGNDSHSLCNYVTGVLNAERQTMLRKRQLIKITLIRKFLSIALIHCKDLSRNKCWKWIFILTPRTVLGCGFLFLSLTLPSIFNF